MNEFLWLFTRASKVMRTAADDAMSQHGVRVGQNMLLEVLWETDGLTPGASGSGTVDIKNTGSTSGAFQLSQSNLTDTPASPGLSSKLTMLIVDQHDPATGHGRSSIRDHPTV